MTKFNASIAAAAADPAVAWKIEATDHQKIGRASCRERV